MIRKLPDRPETMLEKRVRELAEEAIKNGSRVPRIDGASMDDLVVSE